MREDDMATNLNELFVEYQQAKKDGNAARMRAIQNIVVRENYGLVQKLVGKLIRRLVGGFAGDEMDLMQAGAIGLTIAWDRWQPEKGKLSTYAAHWVRHEVQATLHTEQAICKPQQLHKTWRVHKAQEGIRAKTGREATAQELMDVVGLPEMAKVVGVRELPASATQDERTSHLDFVLFKVEGRIEEWRQAPTMGSLGSIGENEEGDALVDGEKFLVDKKRTPSEALEQAETAANIHHGLEALSQVEKYVLEKLFLEEESYKQVAAVLNISEEWVRCHRAAALKKLRRRAEV